MAEIIAHPSAWAGVPNDVVKVDAEDNAKLIAVLEEMLDMARRGDLLAFCSVEVQRDGMPRDTISFPSGQGFHALNSGLVLLHERLIREYRDAHRSD